MAIPPDYDDVDFLVSRRYPGHWNSPSPAVLHDGSPEAHAYEQELRSKSEAEIADLVKAEERCIYEEIAARKSSTDLKRFFNQVPADADFDHWGKLPYWSHDEAVALSYGKDPEVVNWNSLESLLYKSPFVQEYQRRLEWLHRAEHVGQIGNPVVPMQFLDWAGRMGIPIPPNLKSVVDAYATAKVDWQARYKEEQSAHQRTKETLSALQANLLRTGGASGKVADDELHPRERESLLKIIIAIAIEKYGYRHSARSPAARNIADAILRQGLKLHEDTVRTYLQKGAELLAEDPDELQGR